ncbi:N-acetylmuramoyl-L-alanine amidase CwlD [Paenibacillus sp.]|uniref:N-acetylmuramoyl-L-alanine amidase CwlD n=1 Tax=Paenibacillus sp. TaxID=58172 RepID=UPI002D709A7E|nr:N-acetylmuramoyl-L-alanine amidase CwlD [Paenibacillus sp.]HZG55576.1 N-acetylmuramoyl-L-alanine amidase CwlD [Paenibacillus sp.]
MKRHRRVVFWLSGVARRKLATMALMIALIVIVFTNQFPAAKTWTYWTLPLSGKTIVLDAGHGGADGGAKSSAGLQEKEVTLEIVLYLRDYLQQAGASVVLTRDTDTDLASAATKGYSRRKTEDLKARAALVRETRPDLFLSIHLNAIPQPQWYGPQTFYTLKHEDNAPIAWFIQEELRQNVVDTHRQAKRIRNIYVLDRSEVPTALVEVGFLSNEAEAANLALPEYQKQLAAAIYRGVLRYASGEKAPLEPAGAAPEAEEPLQEPELELEEHAEPEDG